jgi:hypothetical protein
MPVTEVRRNDGIEEAAGGDPVSGDGRAAEDVAAFLVDATRVRHGRRADQGAWSRPWPVAGRGPALAWLARRRMRGVSEAVLRALGEWSWGRRPAVLMKHIPAALDVLALQARGLRSVSMVDDHAAAAVGDPRHPDALSFVLHDLEHLEKFSDPEHHAGQVGFFGCVLRALADPGWQSIDNGFDEIWRADRDYVIADMNGSAVFLFAALKMKLRMAVRRKLAHERGVPAPQRGPLDETEEAALVPVVDALLTAMDMPPEVRVAARLVSARRSHPEAARRLLTAFQGAAIPGMSGRHRAS